MPEVRTLWRNRAFEAVFGAARGSGIFGPTGTLDDVRGWLLDAGLKISSLTPIRGRRTFHRRYANRVSPGASR